MRTSTHREVFRVHDFQPRLVKLISAIINVAQVNCHLYSRYPVIPSCPHLCNLMPGDLWATIGASAPVYHIGLCGF